VYGGDYLRKQRSMWDAETHEERPADGETIRRLFEEARAVEGGVPGVGGREGGVGGKGD
jgi:hypothetical protein